MTTSYYQRRRRTVRWIFWTPITAAACYAFGTLFLAAI